MLLTLLMAASSPPTIVRTPPPVFNPVPARPSETYGSWSFTPLKDYAISSTTNASGSAMGVICGKSCSVFVNVMTSCKSGDVYPVLVNSSAGAVSLTLKCHVVDEYYLLATNAEGDVLDAIESGGEVGFAVPLASGKFSVSRFSLGGAMPSIRRAAEYVKSQIDNGRALRDFTL